MSFLSPREDFVSQTLASLSGRLEKLRFVGELREDDGKYHHWGLARIYGEQSSHQAVSEAHTQLFLEILATRIQELFAEAGENAGDSKLQEYVQGLRDFDRQLLPIDLGGGLAEHFSLTLETLCLLARHSNPPSPPNALPLPRPVR